MMEAAPAAALVVAEADLLLELLVIALDQPARLGGMDQVLEWGARRQVGQPVLGWLSAPAGHSISSHSSGQGSERRVSRCAGRTRRAAKREVSSAWLPCRQVTRRQALWGRPRVRALTETG